MNDFKIEGKSNTPNVLFNIYKGVLIITGRSFPEYPADFYAPVIEKVKEVDSDLLSVTIEMDYVNTASAKSLLELLKEAKREVKKVSVIWASEEDDEDMIELGEQYEELLEIDFEYRVFI